MDGQARQLQDEIRVAYDAGDAPRAKTADAFARLALRLAPVAEDAFLTEYALAMADALGADHFLIGRLNPYSNIMRTVRYVVGGELMEGFAYSLDGTPCARAVNGETCIYPENVRALFPRDRDLQDLNIEGYVGAPLCGSGGEALGVAVALTEDPVADPDFARVLIESYRQRVAHAMESAELAERYAWAISEATEGVWDWDVVTGGTTLSQSIQDTLGFQAGKKVYDLTKIEAAIHDDDRPLHVAALQDHLNTGTPYNIRMRLRDHAGVYRWFRSRGKAIRNDEGKPVRMIGCLSDIHDLVMEAERETN